MQHSFADQTIVVTGGARRLGRGIVRAAAASGAHVLFTYHTSDSQAHDLVAQLRTTYPESRFECRQLEVSDAAAVAEFHREAVALMPSITGLVNCAAIFRRTPFEELTEADFDTHIGANLKGPYLLSHAFGSTFRAAGHGAIVNFADIYGSRPLANYIPYCVSKAGVIMLTQSLAKALAPHVRVNCICPGTILPPSEHQGEGDEEAELVRRIPMGRLGTAEEIAETVLFLLGGPQFITGAVLPVDGGQILR